MITMAIVRLVTDARLERVADIELLLELIITKYECRARENVLRFIEYKTLETKA